MGLVFNGLMLYRLCAGEAVYSPPRDVYSLSTFRRRRGLSRPSTHHTLLFSPSIYSWYSHAYHSVMNWLFLSTNTSCCYSLHTDSTLTPFCLVLTDSPERRIRERGEGNIWGTFQSPRPACLPACPASYPLYHTCLLLIETLFKMTTTLSPDLLLLTTLWQLLWF